MYFDGYLAKVHLTDGREIMTQNYGDKTRQLDFKYNDNDSVNVRRYDERWAIIDSTL